VDAICNHDTACLDDCTQEACFGCTVDAFDQCSTEVLKGVCAPYAAGNDCYKQAFSGAASVCNPNVDDGTWYMTVGTEYCGD
jgi:hypothetical protein